MAKKKSTKKSTSSKKPAELYWHYVIPCVVGGAIVWFFTGSIQLAIIVLVAVLIGNYVGSKMMGRK